MKIVPRTLLAAGAIALAAQANAITIFSDDFNGENGGVGVLNYTGFANWTVSDGAVDLIGNGYFDFYPGNGLYVDMDGSRNDAGKMTSSAINVAAGDYVLSFMLGGNARGGQNDIVDVLVATGWASQSYTLSPSDPLATYTLTFSVPSATSINLVFEGLGGDNVGAILDNVKLDSRQGQGVPDGGMSAMLLGMGLLAAGMGRKLVK